MGERSSAARDGGTRQPPQAGPAQAAEVSQCPICLGDINNAAYVAYCMHCFCFACIQWWARRSPVCPLCRQPLELLLHAVRGDDDYEEYVVGLPARLRRRMARERARSRSPQTRYNLRSRPTAANHPSAERRGPAATNGAQRQGAAPGPSDAASQQASAASASREPTPPSAGERPATPAPAVNPRDGTEPLGALGMGVSPLNMATRMQQWPRVVVQRLKREAYELLSRQDAPGPAASQGGSLAPGPAPSGSPARTSVDELPGTSSAALGGGPGSHPSAPVAIPAEQEEPQEEPGEAVPGPSTSSPGREGSPGGPRRPPKRRTSTPKASPANKRPAPPR